LRLLRGLPIEMCFRPQRFSRGGHGPASLMPQRRNIRHPTVP
jgi:hypothetical protein